jgi:hypothetical protein
VCIIDADLYAYSRPGRLPDRKLVLGGESCPSSRRAALFPIGVRIKGCLEVLRWQSTVLTWQISFTASSTAFRSVGFVPSMR